MIKKIIPIKHLLTLSLTLSCASALSAAPPTPSVSPSPSPSPSPKIITSFNGMLSSRYDVSTTPGATYKRLQDSVVFGFTVNPMGIVDLVGLVQTGSAYAKRYETVIDFNKHVNDKLTPTLYFKNLYLQKSFKTFGMNSTAQAGILGSNQKIGTTTFVGPTTAIGSIAWSEGARLSVETPLGDFSVTNGSIADVKEADITHRTRELNYLEVQVSRSVFNKLVVEASGGKYDDEIFFRGAAEYDLQVVSEHMIRLIQEGFYSQKNFSYSTTVSTDVGALLNKKLQGRVNLDLRYAYISPDVGFRGLTMNDITPGRGHVFSTAVYGKVDKAGKLNWFAARDFMDSERFQTGLNWKFKGGNKK